ncbi:hypothetical protein Tco_0663183 [Tanacetum coccineum]
MHTRSSKQEPTTPYLEPERFIHRTKKKKKKRNPFIPLEDRVPKVKYLPSENLFEALVVYNPFLDLPFPMADDQPIWGNNRAVAPTPGAAIIAVDLGESFTVKGNHLSMIKDHQFDSRARSDPHKHISEFIDIYDAKVSFNELSPGVITAWEEMRQAFISKEKQRRCETGAIVAEDHTHPRNVMTNQWEDQNKKKPTMPTEDIEEADIEETTKLGTYDPPVNPNAKTTIIHDDSEDKFDEAEKEVEPSFSKHTKSDPPPLKAYKPKIPYPQRPRKENMEERYAKFIDLIKEVRINVPVIDVLADMPKAMHHPS